MSDMEAKSISSGFVIRIEKGEELIGAIKLFCKERSIQAAKLSGIGAAKNLSLSFFSEKDKTYIEKKFNNNYEIISLSGNISKFNNEIIVHAHIAISDENYNVIGGHLNEAYISVTFEGFLEVFDIQLNRKKHPELNLNLLELTDGS